MLDTIITFIFEIGYIGFFFYMVVVGTFVPLPTQVILLPAGYLAAQGQMDFALVAIITTAGTLTGSLINYTFANKIVRRVFTSRKQKRTVAKIKYIFRQYGKASVLLAPLVPSMGQYISIPAGLSRMPLVWFIPLTYLSNFAWNVLMLSLGYFFGEHAAENVKYVMFGLLLVLITAISVWVLYKLRVHKEEFSKEYYQSPILYLHNHA
ncbi:MAG: DedA family protein [Campylobacterales bacterium]|nr:DedA family protein [Campylobacterales bacterium]